MYAPNISDRCSFLAITSHLFELQSSYPVRQRRCQEILKSPELKTPAMLKLIGDFNKLWAALIELSNIPVSDVT